MSGYPHTLRPELHKALEAEGIDYWLADGITFWNRDDGCECLAYGYQADGVPKLAIKVVGFTDPEQAIAATLGADAKPTKAESSGTLTAEQVRDAVMSADRWKKPMGNTGLTNTHLIVRDDGWQAIADELNATLGSGECHNISKIVDKYGQARFACSECGAWIDSRMLWNPEYRNGESPWVNDCKLNYCPNCGRRIVDPTTNDVDAEAEDG